MKLIHIDEITQEMKLARPIISGGTYLLREGQTELTRYREKLKNIGIEYIYVEDEFSPDIELNETIRAETRRRGQELVQEMFSEISCQGSPDLREAREYVRDLIDEIMQIEDVLINLQDIKTTDSYTYAHSVNVTVLSLLVGRSLELNLERMEKLGLGALTHDVGKSSLPEDILKKPGPLTDKEYEAIKEHPRLGYERLKDLPELPPTSLAVVLGHHESYQGNGYPRGIAGDDIHLYPRIVTITDVFDALTSDRVYRERWTVRKAVDWITSRSGDKFDPELVRHFIRYVTLYPNGTRVRLNDGREALVKEQNENFPARPVIKMMENGGDVLDLTDKLDLIIEDEVTAGSCSRREG